MPVYPDFPPPPRHNRFAWPFTITILVGAVLLLGVGGLVGLGQAHFFLGPTSTPTATYAPALTATPDFRATRVMEDMLAQETYSAVLIARGTPPTPNSSAMISATGTMAQIFLPQTANGSSSMLTPRAVAGANTPVVAVQTVTRVTNLPMISNNSPLPLPLATPIVNSVLPSPTPTTVLAAPNTATPTATLLPSSTPTFIPSPTPTSYAVSFLNGVIRDTETVLRAGPSNIYGEAGRLAARTGVKLLGRDLTGEWVYICCYNNEPRWVRQAYAQPKDNPTLVPTVTPTNPAPTTTPTVINPNDVRWLPVQSLASALEPLPPPTPVPADDYPLYRHDAGHRARVPHVPRAPLKTAWPSPGQAGSGFTSPVVVGGQSVIVASADNQLYCFDRVDGHQRWRFNIGQHIRFAATVQDTTIFVVDDTGQMFALQDNGNNAGVLWQRTLPKPPSSGFIVAGNNASKLYISTTDGSQNQLVAVNRSTGDILSLDFKQTSTAFQSPTVGNQLLYVGGNSVWALDVENFELVWTNTEIQNVILPPVYTANGAVALAELYLADAANHVYSVDANTGVTLWRYDGNEAVTGLAVNATTIFVAGNGYLKAITRNNEHKELWRTAVNGQTPGGPIVDGDQVLMISESGDIQYVNPTDGSLHIDSPLIQSPLSGAPAISGLYIFVPGTNGNLYGLLGNQ